MLHYVQQLVSNCVCRLFGDKQVVYTEPFSWKQLTSAARDNFVRAVKRGPNSKVELSRAKENMHSGDDFCCINTLFSSYFIIKINKSCFNTGSTLCWTLWVLFSFNHRNLYERSQPIRTSLVVRLEAPVYIWPCNSWAALFLLVIGKYPHWLCDFFKGMESMLQKPHVCLVCPNAIVGTDQHAYGFESISQDRAEDGVKKPISCVGCWRFTSWDSRSFGVIFPLWPLESAQEQAGAGCWRWRKRSSRLPHITDFHHPDQDKGFTTRGWWHHFVSFCHFRFTHYRKSNFSLLGCPTGCCWPRCLSPGWQAIFAKGVYSSTNPLQAAFVSPAHPPWHLVVFWGIMKTFSKTQSFCCQLGGFSFVTLVMRMVNTQCTLVLGVLPSILFLE